ncbi:YkyA family protein [Heyndrickxia oleronia]|uniref:YkyA family protein n=1 Tax=Heyndrickxia oleronia TaxID=38875 RepID=UPI001C0F29F1|nr:YkyA family protein [Heyndrickxia oleronia]MBU5210904.1 YkyA family protein [Heyndrickxia oleronia]
MARYKLLLLLVLILGLLTGCKVVPEEKIYDIMEQTVVKEKDFEKQQKPLTELESKEKKIFEEIMDLGMKDMEQMTKLANLALDNLKERKEKMELEQKSMIASKKEFSKIEDPIEKIESKQLKKEAQDLFQLMEKRYAFHDRLYEAYNKGIETNIQLYKLLMKKDVSMDDLENQIEITNKAYLEVLKMNEQFNEQTKKFNNEKKKFYKLAKINID